MEVKRRLLSNSNSSSVFLSANDRIVANAHSLNCSDPSVNLTALSVVERYWWTPTEACQQAGLPYPSLILISLPNS